jgi:ABC-type sulfate transport system substrate-binding protein
MARRPLGLMAAGSVAVFGLAACGSDAGASSEGQETVTLALVAYSTPQEAYEEIIAAFQKTSEGENVEFTTSFGGSGDQSRAVEAGQPADVVAFSLEPDMTRLVKAGIVAAWSPTRWSSSPRARAIPRTWRTGTT